MNDKEIVNESSVHKCLEFVKLIDKISEDHDFSNLEVFSGLSAHLIELLKTAPPPIKNTLIEALEIRLDEVKNE